MKSCREETISFKAPYTINSAESFLADNLPVVVYYFFWGGEWRNETNKQNYNWGHNFPWQRGETDLVVGLITAPLGSSLFEGFGIPNQPLTKNDACFIFHFLHCFASEPVRPGVRSLRRYYISSILQIEAQRKTKFISFCWCLDRVCFIIHDFLRSRLREISVRLLQHCSRRDIRGVNFHQLENFQVLASSS